LKIPASIENDGITETIKPVEKEVALPPGEYLLAVKTNCFVNYNIREYPSNWEGRDIIIIEFFYKANKTKLFSYKSALLFIR